MLFGDNICMLEIKSFTIYKTRIKQPNMKYKEIEHRRSYGWYSNRTEVSYERINDSIFNGIIMDSGEVKYVLINGYFRDCHDDDMMFIARDLVILIMRYFCDERLYYLDHEKNLYSIDLNTLYDHTCAFFDTDPWF